MKAQNVEKGNIFCETKIPPETLQESILPQTLFAGEEKRLKRQMWNPADRRDDTEAS